MVSNAKKSGVENGSQRKAGAQELAWLVCLWKGQMSVSEIVS